MIRRSLVASAVVLFTLVASTVSAAAAPASTAPAQYYLALGDSLSKGYMPGPGDTDQGYVDGLYAALHAENSALQLVKLGCSGETSATMINGGVCTYSGAASQLQAATAFLKAHRGAVKYMTLDIGANDVDKCAPGGSVDVSCALNGVSAVGTNTAKILASLRLAGGFTPHLVGMTYYNPFLAAWLTGADGQSTARLSDLLTQLLNLVLSSEYQVFGGQVANVYAAYNSGDFTDQATLPGIGAVPVNVATICTLTYMCTLRNIHPTVTGYQLIAATFAKTLGLK
ncbi:lysophospholipase L1-like esterase [Jatrophihabitans sp. GAS493]|uniref:SGNH/GDSL hydrolase family protein n=1 Tax=Jatrophihabitans sp. GAS493 TaxID=1907575 RepID=UPI000BB8649A|nr:GDSL-type esterase/lipase family protein [Jatrophihabitans sp. GAS493]SOD74198.1 lysophospholipase L1-like esterase [Jatrophihabitans sp. GAS493]